jgi:ferrochelatase
LLQLGGPQDLDSIKPFLHNLFADVLPGPMWLRQALGRLIAWRRTPKVRPLYAALGGGSPLLANTQAQADALAATLRQRGLGCAVQVVMRYAPPRLPEALDQARALGPQVPWIVLPLYPHFSYATTRSSLCEFAVALTPEEGQRLHIVDAYPTEPGYIAASVQRMHAALAATAEVPTEAVHVVFSAHGLPQKLVREGDPYPEHVRATVQALAAALPRPHPWTLAYQSRVGPVKWLTPSTSETLQRLGKSGVRHVVVVPVSFVSEHIETLQELDVELRDEAKHAGIVQYERAATVGTHPAFIGGLADAVAACLQAPPPQYATPGACLCGPSMGTPRCRCA